jgi:membrane protease YdiL (CAAX protease family)
MRKRDIKGAIVRLLPIIVISLVLIVYNVIVNYDSITSKKIFEILMNATLAGVGEELIFRKILLGFMLKKNEDKYITYIIICAALFGVVHLSNLFYGAPVVDVICQVISASMAGIMFGFVYYNSRSFILCALIHTLYDIAALMSTIGGQETSMQVIIETVIITALVSTIIAAFISKKKNVQNILIALGIILAFTIILV